MTPHRPVLRYYGGKWMLAPWIISRFPPHQIYIEPFGGAASVLLRKPRSYSEVYNDLDGHVVNLFRILQDKTAADELVRRLTLTPFSRAEFELSYSEPKDDIDRARFLAIRAFMGFGSNAHNTTYTTGFRANSTRSNTTAARDWANYPASLQAIVERFRGVVIESREAIDVMKGQDRPGCLHYVDPPYMPETRGIGNPYCLKARYNYELTIDQHEELLWFLRGLKGMVVLSGYRTVLYDEVLGDWQRLEKNTFADGARARTECLWLNRAAVEASVQSSLDLRAAE